MPIGAMVKAQSTIAPAMRQSSIVRTFSRGREILGVAAKVISDPDQLRVFDDSGPRHYGIVSLVGVVFSVLESGHCDSSLSGHHLRKNKHGEEWG